MCRFLLVALLVAACVNLSAAAVGRQPLSSSSSSAPASSSTGSSSWQAQSSSSSPSLQYPALSSSSVYPSFSSSTAVPAIGSSSASSTVPVPNAPVLYFYRDTSMVPIYTFNYTSQQAYAAYHPNSAPSALSANVAFQFAPTPDLTSNYAFVAYVVPAATMWDGLGSLSCSDIPLDPTSYLGVYTGVTFDPNDVATWVSDCTYTYDDSVVPANFTGTIPLVTVIVYLIDAVATTNFVSVVNGATMQQVQSWAVTSTQLQFDMNVQPQPVVIATVSNALSGRAGNTTLLVSGILLQSNVLDSITLTANVDIGNLSAASFTGSIAALKSAIAGWTYTAPALAPPSAYYPAGDPHNIGDYVYDRAVAILSLNLTSSSTGTSYFTFPIVIALVNQPPTITVTDPTQFANLSVAAGNMLTLSSLQTLVYADVDGYGFTETVSVRALSGTVCQPAQSEGGVAQCGSFTFSASLASLNNDKYGWNLQYGPPIPTGLVTTAIQSTGYVQVTLNDDGHSGSIQQQATYTFPITVLTQTVATAPQVSLAPVNVLQLNTTSLVATWPSYSDTNPANRPISYYVISYGTASVSTPGQLSFTTTLARITVPAAVAKSYSLVISGLTPATLYWVTLTAGNTIGESVSSTYSSDVAQSTYPVQSTTCGPTQYCGVQWTQALTQPAPTVQVHGDNTDAYYLYVSIAPNSTATSSASIYYNLSYAPVSSNGTVGAWTTRQLYPSFLGYTFATLTGFAPSTTYIVSTFMYDTFFNVYSQATNVTYVTLATAPTIVALTVSVSSADPDYLGVGTMAVDYINMTRATKTDTLFGEDVGYLTGGAAPVTCTSDLLTLPSYHD